MLAILSDFDDLDNEEELHAAKATLEILKASVLDDEASGFDASGASGAHDVINEPRGDGSPSGSSQGASQTDATSLSHGMSGLDLEGLDSTASETSTPTEESEHSFTSELDDLSIEDKEDALTGIFPTLRPFDIKWTLKKYKGDASLAIDELMNESFLQEEGIRHKGIDAFSENDIPPRPRKGKGKKKKGRATVEDGGTEDSESPVQSKWETGGKDMEFIASKIGMPTQQVSSIYHKSGGSVRATITAIIEAHKALNINDDDPMTQINTFELHQAFPTLQTQDLEALIQLTHPHLTSAHSLAQTLISRPSAPKTPIHLSFRHAPISLSPPSTPTSSVPKPRPLDPTTANALTNTYTTARNTAFSAASSYYRKGKSDPLMSGAAAYYAQEGRNMHALAKAAESDAADALVAGQSSRERAFLDLHGVSVRDAVRISREGVTGWWASEGRSGNSGGRGGIGGGGYLIVTGQGRHSAGGRSRLGPAVVKMLVGEGWRVEVLSGKVLVKGVVR